MYKCNISLQVINYLLKWSLLLCLPLIGTSQVVVEPSYLLIGRDSLPASGELVADTLFFFDSEKAALRAGDVNSLFWSPDSLGTFSIGLGYRPKATGVFAATSLGHATKAKGDFGATALGYFTIAGGLAGATALGDRTWASGEFGTTALGSQTEASGDFGATALGRKTTANGDVGLVIGQYNDTIVPAGQDIIATSPLFIIGNGAFNAPSNAMVVRKDGNVGVGTNVPEAKVHIGGVGDESRILLENGGDIMWKKSDSSLEPVLSLHTNDDVLFDSPEDFILSSNSVKVMHIDASGNVGIGGNTPGEKLDVKGNARFTGIGSAVSSNKALFVTSDGTLSTNSSDSRLKENLIESKDLLGRVLQLKTYTYNYKSDPVKIREYGLIAQELEKIFPELVFTNPNSGYKGIHYEKLSVLLIQALKEQQDMMNEIKKDFENRLSKLESSITP